MKNNTLLKITPIFTLIFIVVLWSIIAMAVNVKLIFPSPISSLKTLFNLLKESVFYISVLNTILRIIICFLISLLLSFILAMLSLVSKIFEKLFYPLIIFVRATPTMSVIFLCIVWFTSKQTPIIVASAITLPMLYTAILEGVKECDKNLVEMSCLFKVPLKRQILQLYLPSVFNRLFEESILAITLTVKLIISAEALSQTKLSVGNLMSISKANLETAELFAYTITMVLISYLFEIFMRFTRKIVGRIIKCFNS